MRGVVAAYRRLLGNGPLTRLLAGEFISSIGDWLYLVALMIIIYQRTQDAVILGIVGAARILPYVFLSVPAGIVADRYDRRLVLMATDLGRAALMLVLAWLVASDGPIEAIVGVTILATCLSTFFGPTIGAYIPSMVRTEADLGPANTVYASLDNIAYVVGPAVAAIILAISTQIWIAFLLNALTFVFVAAILWRLPPSRPGASVGDGAEGKPPPEPFDLRTVRRPIIGLVLFSSVDAIVFGGIAVLTVVIAYDQLHGGEAATGALNSAMGVGGLLGAVAAGVLVLRRRQAPPLLLGALVMAVSVAVLGLTDSLSVSLVAMAAASGGSLLVSVVCETLFQRIVPDEVRGRALGFLGTVTVLMFAIGSLALPAAAQVVGVTPVLIVSAVAMAVAMVLTIVALGPFATQVPADVPVKRWLTDLEIFRGLPPGRIETAERHAVVVPVTAGQVIIRQGDPADRFYVIAEGTAEVTQTPAAGGPAVVLRTMGAGEAFGEIGLLAGSRRTATVTARSAGTLVALDGESFLELVNGAGVTFPFLEIHRGQATSAA